ncbi:MAG: hypothetical protein ACLQDL_16825 [Spirochaetia bacterium]
MNTKRFLLSMAVMAASLVFSSPANSGLRFGVGMLNTRQDPVDNHFAANCIDTIDFLSTTNLALALDAEAWVTYGPYQRPPGGDLATLPVLLGVRSTLFPSSPVRPYGTVCGGVCISNHTWTVEQTQGFLIWQWEGTAQKSEGNCSLACAVGTGIEIASGNILFSIDYRYLVAFADGTLGGHLLCLGIGFGW